MAKCVVKGCTNEAHGGLVASDLCAPCYTMMATGEVNGFGSTFVHMLAGKFVLHEYAEITEDQWRSIR